MKQQHFKFMGEVLNKYDPKRAIDQRNVGEREKAKAEQKKEGK